MLAADLVAGGALQALLHTVSHDVRVQLSTCILLRPARPIGIIAVMAAYLRFHYGRGRTGGLRVPKYPVLAA